MALLRASNVDRRTMYTTMRKTASTALSRLFRLPGGNSVEKPSAASDAHHALALGFGLAALGNVVGLIQPRGNPPLYLSASGALLYAAALVDVLRPGPLGRGPQSRERNGVLDRLADTGLTSRNLIRSLAAGALVGLALGAPGLALARLPEELAPAVHQGQRMTPLAAARFIFGQLLLFTALSEELVFRGTLQRRLRISFQARDAILLSSFFFMLWHGVFNARTLAATGVTGKLRFGLGSVLQTLSVYLGGLAFGWLHERWGNLAGSIMAHWLVDILLNTPFLTLDRPHAARLMDHLTGRTRRHLTGLCA